MSHHLDSPLARQDVRLDITDLYVFRGEAGTVFAINVCHSLAGDIPTPGYHPGGQYEFKIDLDHDGVEDLTYRFVFGERDELGRQSLTVHRIAGTAATDPFAAGTVVATGQTGGDARRRRRTARVGRQGRRPVLDRARRPARRRPRLPGRYDDRPRDLDPRPGDEPVRRAHRLLDRPRDPRRRTARRRRRRPGRSTSGPSPAWPRTRAAGARSTGSASR